MPYIKIKKKLVSGQPSCSRGNQEDLLHFTLIVVKHERMNEIGGGPMTFTISNE